MKTIRDRSQESVDEQSQRFVLSPSTIAEYFKFKCDRLLRWHLVPRPLRGAAGIGWRVPHDRRITARPGVNLLVTQGDEFEVDRIDQLIAAHQPGEVLTRGYKVDATRTTIEELPFIELADLIRSGPVPRFATQIRIEFDREHSASFVRRFGLDPSRLALSVARPDLIEFIPEKNREGTERFRLRVWDIKASRAARHEHFIQVAYYSFLLEYACTAFALDTLVVDTTTGVIDCREGAVEFDLAPYRLAVAGFLRNRLPRILETAPHEARFHLTERCVMCQFDDTCRSEASAGNDLSLIPWLSAESKRQLQLRGLRTVRDVALLGEKGREDLVEDLRHCCYDLSLNIDRYIATSQALEDGVVRPLDTKALLMPTWEDVRLTVTAEQDPVTATCFALGLRVSRFNRDQNTFTSSEHVFVAEQRGDERSILLPFLRQLNALLRDVDASNRAIVSEPIDNDPIVVQAQKERGEYEKLQRAFRARCPRIPSKGNPDRERLAAERDALKECDMRTARYVKDARKEADRGRRRRLERLQFYFYDPFDLDVLKRVIERHLFDEDPDILDEIRELVRLFPPESLMKDVETFRSIPGSVISQVLRLLAALPVPYMYDLKTVSRTFVLRDGEEEFKAFEYRPPFGFDWPFTNQIAFERIHDVWNNRSFRPSPQRPERDISPSAILQKIRETIVRKLRAADSLVRGIRILCDRQLLLRKEPFFLSSSFDPISFQRIEALRLFNLLEVSLQELEIREQHALPLVDRINRLVCMSGLRLVERADDGSAWFSFDEGSRDGAFDIGEFNLVVTPQDSPEVLIGDVDGKLFSRFGRSADTARVTVWGYDMSASPPRILLQPYKPKSFYNAIDDTTTYVLDRVFIDYNSTKVDNVLRDLASHSETALHVSSLLHDLELEEWSPLVDDPDTLAAELEEMILSTNEGELSNLNTGQWRAWKGVFREPLTLIWGPPGTGKTQTLAAIVVGYALASRRLGKRLCILVTAFTHAAIDNVFRKAAALAEALSLGKDRLQFIRLKRTDDVAPQWRGGRIHEMANEQLLSALAGETDVTIVGATVWGVANGVKETAQSIHSLFDVVLIDEASQMKLPESLIPCVLTTSRANIILAGDDKQLPPIIQGDYPEQHDYMLSSVFAFMRHRIEELERGRPGIRSRSLFQLSENFRMNESLTAFPRHPLYDGNYLAVVPDRRLWMKDPPVKDILHALLDPQRPVMLVTYTPLRSYTARNPVEASLVVALADRLAQVMLCEGGGEMDANRFAEEGLALLAPHRAQNALIRSLLEEKGYGRNGRPMPLVNTVEKLQGQERDVVLVSYGVADEEYAEAEASFLLSSNRLNVSLTRGRSKVILVCSETVLDLVPSDRDLAEESMLLKSFRQYCSDGSMAFDWDGVAMTATWKEAGG